MNDRYIKTDREGLVREKRSGAILNVNNDELANYRKRKQAFDAQQQFRENIGKRIDNIEHTLSKIVELLGKQK